VEFAAADLRPPGPPRRAFLWTGPGFVDDPQGGYVTVKRLPKSVMPGLDPGIHLIAGTMDPRIKSAGDASRLGGEASKLKNSVKQ